MWNAADLIQRDQVPPGLTPSRDELGHRCFRLIGDASGLSGSNSRSTSKWSIVAVIRVVEPPRRVGRIISVAGAQGSTGPDSCSVMIDQRGRLGLSVGEGLISWQEKTPRVHRGTVHAITVTATDTGTWKLYLDAAHRVEVQPKASDGTPRVLRVGGHSDEMAVDLYEVLANRTLVIL